MTDINKMKLPELQQYCRDNKIKGFSQKKKKELIAHINENQQKQQPQNTTKEEETIDQPTKVATESSEPIKKKPEKKVETFTEEELSPVETETIKLYLGDCLERMKTIPDDSVELILCDLPYGTTKCKWDTPIDITKMWEQYRRILKKPHGVICLFGQQPFTSRLISSNFEWFKYNLIWKKNKTTRYLLANYRPMSCTEDIAIFSPGGAAAASRETGNMTYNPQGLIPVDIKKHNSEKRIGKMLNQLHHLGPNNKLTSGKEYSQKFTNYPKELIEFNIESNTIHETQKPTALCEYLIKTYSNNGDTVLDNAMGSGTTGVACINTKRKFIGIELLEKYYVLSKKRISDNLEEKDV